MSGRQPGSRGERYPATSAYRRRGGSIHDLPEIDGPNQGPGAQQLLPGSGQLVISLRVERVSLAPGSKARTIVGRYIIGLQTGHPFTGLTLGLVGAWQPVNLTVIVPVGLITPFQKTMRLAQSPRDVLLNRFRRDSRGDRRSPYRSIRETPAG